MATTRLCPSRIAGRCSPRAANVSKRARARRSPRRNRSSRESSMGRPAPLAQAGDDLGQRGPGAENAGNAHLLQLGNVALRNDAADQYLDVVEPRVAQELQ